MPGEIRFGTERLKVPVTSTNLRSIVQRHLRVLATRELREKVMHHASAHGLAVRRVTIRDQKSRWGSCSSKGTISLNWRLIQTPASVSEYVILHELAHLRHMNHSTRFWQEVEKLCPDYRRAQLWLKEHQRLLH
jgi:predicted metal-dependent hydrolase